MFRSDFRSALVSGALELVAYRICKLESFDIYCVGSKNEFKNEYKGVGAGWIG